MTIDWDENLETLVATDPHNVGQIISNLVNNALKFTKRGQITVQVDRHISPHAKFMIELRVTDTGIGKPDKFLKHFFDDFTTLDNSYTRTSSGVGLGLVIVRRMVVALNGTMGVNSHEMKVHAAHFRFASPCKKFHKTWRSNMQKNKICHCIRR